MARHLTFDDILEVNKDVMGRGGHFQAPLRDERGLTALLLRVRNEDERATSDDARLAAILAVGLAQGRPFERGHIETAVGALSAFLGFNGMRLQVGSLPELGPYLRVISEEHESDEAIERFAERLRARLRT
mgnify:CR=1 FL=1